MFFFKGWVIKRHLEDAGSYCSLLFIVGVVVAGCTIIIIVCLSRWFVTADVSQLFFQTDISGCTTDEHPIAVSEVKFVRGDLPTSCFFRTGIVSLSLLFSPFSMLGFIHHCHIPKNKT